MDLKASWWESWRGQLRMPRIRMEVRRNRDNLRPQETRRGVLGDRGVAGIPTAAGGRLGYDHVGSSRISRPHNSECAAPIASASAAAPGVHCANHCSGSRRNSVVVRSNPLRTFPDRANEATALVDAVYRFRNDTGLWPEDFSELVPEYTRTIPAEWEFIWGGYENEQSSVLRLRGPLHMKLEYEFLPSGATNPEGWTATCEGDPLPVNVRQSVPSLVPPSENDRRKTVLRVLQRRIEREPEVEGHRAALARCSIATRETESQHDE